MLERPDRLREGGDVSTDSEQAKKVTAPPHHGRRRQRERGSGGVIKVASQIMDPTQHQHQHDAYQPQYEQAQQQEGEAQQETQEEEVGPEFFLWGGLLTCHFYRGSIATWHVDYEATPK